MKCENHVSAGQKCGWIALENRVICRLCVEGKDSNRASFSQETLDYVDRRVDRGNQLLLLPRPRSDSAESELQSIATELRAKYSMLRNVQLFLARFLAQLDS